LRVEYFLYTAVLLAVRCRSQRACLAECSG